MPTVTVEEARRTAARWVNEQGLAIPGFAGAFLHGSINWMPLQAAFPATSDVDVFVLSDAAELPERTGKIRYGDVLLEVSVMSPNRIGSAEKVLGDHRLAGTFSKDCVLEDPTGFLRDIQRSVSRDFAKRVWVLQRCKAAQEHSLDYLRADDPNLPLYDQVTLVSFGAAITTDVLMVAALKNTTVRRKFSMAREMLAEKGKSDVYEFLLRLFGCAEMTHERVLAHLERLESVFDVASKLDKPGYRFASDISPASRQVAIDGSRQLIDEGHHRDAVFWLVATYSRCLAVFDGFGPPGMLEEHLRPFTELTEDLGIATYEARRRRAALVEESYSEIWRVAEQLMYENPDITD